MVIIFSTTWWSPSKNSWYGVLLPSVERAWLFQLSWSSSSLLFIIGRKTWWRQYRSTSFIGSSTSSASKDLNLWANMLVTVNITPESFYLFIMDRTSSEHSRGITIMASNHKLPYTYVFSSMIRTHTFRQTKSQYSSLKKINHSFCSIVVNALQIDNSSRKSIYCTMNNKTPSY